LTKYEFNPEEKIFSYNSMDYAYNVSTQAESLSDIKKQIEQEFEYKLRGKKTIYVVIPYLEYDKQAQVSHNYTPIE